MSELETSIIPTFNEEPEAKIKSLGEIESNINQLKQQALEMKDYYSNIKFTEESLKVAKEEKTKVNKFKTMVSTFRKNIVSEFKKPIDVFENTAKDVEKICSDTYDIINAQVKKYDDEQKEKITQEIKAYFDEYKATKNIVVEYEKANIKVNLNSSRKALKEEVKAFIDKIATDLELINSQQYKEEILFEYNKSLNASEAILTVNNRMKAIEEQKVRQLEEEKRRVEENLRQQTETTAKALDNFKTQEILQAPKIEEINKEEPTMQMTFTVTGTKTQLHGLKEFLINNNIKFKGGN